MKEKKKCLLCEGDLILSTKHKIGYQVYVCIKCNQLFYSGGNKSGVIIKNGIKYMNLDL